MQKDKGASAGGPGCEPSASAADGVFAKSHPSRDLMKPLPTEEFLALPDRDRALEVIGDVIAYWLKWEAMTRKCEVEALYPDTYIILPGDNAPPHWPPVDMLRNWLRALRVPSDSNSDRDGGDANAAPCAASQSGPKGIAQPPSNGDDHGL